MAASPKSRIEGTPTPFVVRGLVTDANLKPLARMTVRAFDRDLRFSQLLGEVQTDANGDYRIEYLLDAFRLAESPSRDAAWLVVEVLEASDGNVLARQEVQKAAHDQTVLFTLTDVGAVSEWQRITEAVGPLLLGQGSPGMEMGSHVGTNATSVDLAAWELTPADVDFIAQDAELDRAAVEAWAASSRMLQDALRRFDDDHAGLRKLVDAYAWPFFYGQARSRPAITLDEILNQGPEQWAQSKRGAEAVNRTPVLDEAVWKQLSAALLLLANLRRLDPAYAPADPFANLLAAAPQLPSVVAMDALAIYQENGLDALAFETLISRYPDDASAIRRFARAVRIHGLVDGDLPLVKELDAHIDEDTASTEPLVRLSREDWLGVVERASSTQANAGESAATAHRLQATLEAEHALPALASRMKQGALRFRESEMNELQAHADKYPQAIAALLGGKTAAAGVEALPKTVQKTVRNLGRFSRGGLTYEVACDLMNLDVDTPAAAHGLGADVIVDMLEDKYDKYKREAIERFIEKTEIVAGSATGLVSHLVGDRLVPALFADGAPVPEIVNENLPTLRGFFGGLDECMCRPCESVLGQPAYLVDLLNLLKKVPAGRSPEGALSLLRKRRPDVCNLELTCENAETELPYIDLVLEVLGNAAAIPGTRQPFPWILPFDLAHAEAALVLDRLGTPRAELIGLHMAPDAVRRAAETLGIALAQHPDTASIESEWALISYARSGAQLWAAWGLTLKSDGSVEVRDPMSGAAVTGLPMEILARVSVLMDRAAVDLDTLEQVLATRFAGGSLTISRRDQCKTSEMRVEGLTEAHLDRIHRFIRLYKKLDGWPIPLLDLAIQGSGASDLADDIKRVATVERLSRRLALPVGQVLVPSVTAWGQALGIRTRQLQLVQALCGIDPFDGTAGFARLEEFCDAVDLIRASGASIEDTAYALLPFDALPAHAVQRPVTRRSDGAVRERLQLLQAALREAETPSELDVMQALSGWMDPAIARRVVAGVDSRVMGPATAAIDPQIAAPLWQPAPGIRRLGETAPLFDEQEALALFAQPPDAARTDAEQALRRKEVQRRHSAILDRIAQRWSERRREQRLVETVAAWTGWTPAATADLLQHDLGMDAGNLPVAASEVLLDPAFWAGDMPPSVESREDLREWVHRVDRLAVLTDVLKVPAEIWHLLAQASAGPIEGIDLRDMLAPSTFDVHTRWMPRWPAWKAFVSLADLVADDQLSLGVVKALFVNLASGQSAADPRTLAPLAERLSLTADEAFALARHTVGDPPTIGRLRDPVALKRLVSLAQALRGMRASAAQFDALVDCSRNRDAARVARQLLETKSAAAWPAALDAITNNLRQLQRDALVAHLVHRDGWRDANDLYEHYLIDPQMQPCMSTTRILQATAAVQLLAQRILFGLEPDVRVPEGSQLRRQWPWMRNYRVWEANRKVFLYPENWLFPELRDDKSSSFKLLESALGQGELTQDLAKQSFGQFLDDVAQTGQTQVIGMYEDANDDRSRRVLYVVGRSANPPYLYFWRRCDDFGSRFMEWSPWQRIELDIQGDHVLPFVLAGALHVAWPVFKRNDEGSSQARRWQIRLSWSRYDGKSWLRQETSRDAREVDVEPFRDEREGFAFRVESSPSPQKGISIRCFAAQRPAGSTWEPPTTTSDSQSWPAGSHVALTARYWIKLYRDNGTDAAWMELDPAQAGIRLINVSVNAPLDPSWYAWPRGANGAATFHPYEIVADLAASVVLRGQTYDFPNEPIQVPRQTIKNYTLHFKLDQGLKASDVGLTIPSADNFSCVAVFELDALQQVRVLAGAGDMTSPAGQTRPWMNGVLQLGDTGGLTLSEPSANREIALFAQTAGPVYWLLGAGSRRMQPAIPDVWYFEEGGARCYVDIATPDRPRFSGFRLFPDSFRESRKVAAAWQERSTIASPALQAMTFDVEQIPVPTAAVSVDTWLPATPASLAFDSRMPYAGYNWEIFFHAPLLIADQLSKQHKFEDAERWLRSVFDPTSGEPGGDARRFLKFRVFQELDTRSTVMRELTVLAQVAAGNGMPEEDDAIGDLIDRWRDAPFQPFLVARRRHVAFLWRTLFAYLDNLIAWADSLFRRDTRESVNEAILLYVLAARILGPRPKSIKAASRREPRSYDDLAGEWDEFANQWFDAANVPDKKRRPWAVESGRPLDEPQASPQGFLLFCIPVNDKLVGYWNVVDERLFNIRHCRDIEGITRDLPLTDASIDPELLVRAAAAGLDLSDAISGLYAAPPHYRYGVLSARASELANEAKALGGAMLSAIEKRDAEELSQLRSSNEINLLKLVGEVRTLQIGEAERHLDALRATRKSVAARYGQYQRLLGKKDIKVPGEQESAGEESMLGVAATGLASPRSNLGLIKEEGEQYTGFDGAAAWSVAASIAKTTSGASQLAAAVAAAYPTDLATSVSKVLGYTAQGASVLGDAFSIASGGWRNYAEQQGMSAGHLRRRDEWAFQGNQTLKELQQIDKQILANEIRIQIARREQANQVEQIEQAMAVDEVMRGKFSNAQLYQWMVSQLSGLYFGAHRMALGMARSAERAAARELGTKPLNVIRNDYWDSLRSGLLSGERLHQDIKRLEVAYLDQNRREFELTKHVSLRRLDPQALVNLRVTQTEENRKHNRCEFEIPEWLFDLDTPGHYLRRIKSVSVGIPCVVGPYASVHCKLTLLKSEVRHDKTATAPQDYPRRPSDDNRFTDAFGASEAVVTSTGSADSGLFETPLRDERFLPFESSGVVSRWRLELPGEFPQFDYSTISDVVLSIRYTARDGGESLRDHATAAIRNSLAPPQPSESLRFPIFLSCRSDFPSEWARARADANLTIRIGQDVLPYWLAAAGMVVKEIATMDLPVTPSGAPAFSTVWRAGPAPTGASWIAGLDASGFGEADLGRPGAGLADRLVLLSVGGRRV